MPVVVYFDFVLSANSCVSRGRVERAFGGRREFPPGRPRPQNRTNPLAQRLPPPRPLLARVARPPRLTAPQRGPRWPTNPAPPRPGPRPNTRSARTLTGRRRTSRRWPTRNRLAVAFRYRGNVPAAHPRRCPARFARSIRSRPG